MFIQSIAKDRKIRLTKFGEFVYMHEQYKYVHLELIEVHTLYRSSFYFSMYSLDSKEYWEIYTL